LGGDCVVVVGSEGEEGVQSKKGDAGSVTVDRGRVGTTERFWLTIGVGHSRRAREKHWGPYPAEKEE